MSPTSLFSYHIHLIALGSTNWKIQKLCRKGLHILCPLSVIQLKTYINKTAVFSVAARTSNIHHCHHKKTQTLRRVTKPKNNFSKRMLFLANYILLHCLAGQSAVLAHHYMILSNSYLPIKSSMTKRTPLLQYCIQYQTCEHYFGIREPYCTGLTK